MEEIKKEFDLKAELKALGMTQKDFAKYTEINHNTVSRWITGDLLMPKWVERLIENYKKAKTLDEIIKQQFFIKV